MIRKTCPFIHRALRALLALSCGVALNAHGDTLKSEAEARQLADKVMAQVARSDLDAAFALMKPYAVIPSTEFDALALQSRSAREQYGARYGKPYGQEFISERRAGESLLRLVYVEKTARHALPWNFLFYKTPQGWVLNSFGWNDAVQQLFQ